MSEQTKLYAIRVLEPDSKEHMYLGVADENDEFIFYESHSLEELVRSDYQATYTVFQIGILISHLRGSYTDFSFHPLITGPALTKVESVELEKQYLNELLDQQQINLLVSMVKETKIPA